MIDHFDTHTPEALLSAFYLSFGMSGGLLRFFHIVSISYAPISTENFLVFLFLDSAEGRHFLDNGKNEQSACGGSSSSSGVVYQRWAHGTHDGGGNGDSGNGDSNRPRGGTAPSSDRSSRISTALHSRSAAAASDTTALSRVRLGHTRARDGGPVQPVARVPSSGRPAGAARTGCVRAPAGARAQGGLQRRLLLHDWAAAPGGLRTARRDRVPAAVAPHAPAHPPGLRDPSRHRLAGGQRQHRPQRVPRGVRRLVGVLAGHERRR